MSVSAQLQVKSNTSHTILQQKAHNPRKIHRVKISNAGQALAQNYAFFASLFVDFPCNA